MQEINNMTEGKPFRHYVKFAVPMIISDVFYQFYVFADGIVASRLIGLGAFAAISSAGFFYLFILDAILGFSHGIGTRFAQLYGARRFDEARNSAAISMMLALGIGVLMSAACLFITPLALTAMNTPPEIMEDATIYLYCMFAGLIPTFLYKSSSAIFFGMGDSKTPLKALIICSVMNISLSIALVLMTPLGVAAIGISTVLSQLIACLYFFICLSKNKDLRLSPGDFRINREELSQVLRISVPISARNAVSALGGVVIQYVINGYGVAYIAGIAAAQKLYVAMFMISNAMEPAIVTFIAQNFGAGKFDRVKEGMKTAKRIMLIYSTGIMALMLFVGPWILKLMIGEPADVAVVSEAALNQLRASLIFLPALYMLLLYRSGLQGMGRSTETLISGILEGGLRIIAIFLLPLFIGTTGLYLSEVIAWPVCALQLFFAYSVAYRRNGGG